MEGMKTLRFLQPQVTDGTSHTGDVCHQQSSPGGFSGVCLGREPKSDLTCVVAERHSGLTVAHASAIDIMETGETLH